MEGFSGPVVCLDQVHAEACRAICFQDFQTPLYRNDLLRHYYRRSPPDTTSYPTVKGGFLLSNEVREAEIFSENPGATAAPGKFSSHGRNSREGRQDNENPARHVPGTHTSGAWGQKRPASKPLESQDRDESAANSGLILFLETVGKLYLERGLPMNATRSCNASIPGPNSTIGQKACTRRRLMVFYGQGRIVE